MTKHLLFAGKAASTFHETIGYLRCLVDQEILREPITSGEVWKTEDIDLLFFRDKKAKEVLQSLSPNLPQRYVAFRAGVANEAGVEKVAAKMCERFGLEYRIYDSQS